MINLTLPRLLASLCLMAVLGACDPMATPPQAANDGATVLAGTTLPATQRGTANPATPWISYAGGDGSSLEKAILIKGAKGDSDGVQTEYDWLAKYMPGWHATEQALITKNGRAYDVLYVTKSGAKKAVYFDITEYFGKF